MKNSAPKESVRSALIKNLEKKLLLSKCRPIKISLFSDREVKEFLRAKRESEKKALEMDLKF